MHELHPTNLSVSRETFDKLRSLEELVQRWSLHINLVSRADLKALWERHILDSAQLVPLAETTKNWVDLGSGNGFPGLVVAILLEQHPSVAQVTLVESDKRKCTFLLTAARELSLNVKILSQRIEDSDHLGASTLSARALAGLDKLIEHAHNHMCEDGIALFPKGNQWPKERDRAKERWSFDLDVVESVINKDAVVLKIWNIKKN